MSETGREEVRTYDVDPSNLPPDLLVALGLIAPCGAQTEDRLNDLIAALAETDLFRGAAMTTNMNAPMRHNVIRTFGQLSSLPPSALDEQDDRPILGRKLARLQASA